MKIHRNEDRAIGPEIFRYRRSSACIDLPRDIISDPIAFFSGWFASLEKSEPEFYVNDVRQNSIDFFERRDLTETTHGRFSVGWTFHCDVLRLMTAEQRAIVLEVRIADQIITRGVFRCMFKCVFQERKFNTFFLHMPKTGGTSIRMLLENQSDKISMLKLYDVPGYIRPDEFSNFSSNSLAMYDVIFGHFKYGLHQMYNTDYKYISVIRNPFEFIRSYYFFHIYTLERPDYQSYGNIIRAIERSGDPAFDNLFTRFFANVPDTRSVCKDDFQLAIENINNDFIYIGITESMRDTKSYLSKFFGVKLGYTTENKTPIGEEIEFFDVVGFRKMAKHYVRYDLALYEHVLELFWGNSNTIQKHDLL